MFSKYFDLIKSQEFSFELMTSQEFFFDLMRSREFSFDSMVSQDIVCVFKLLWRVEDRLQRIALTLFKQRQLPLPHLAPTRSALATPTFAE